VSCKTILGNRRTSNASAWRVCQIVNKFLPKDNKPYMYIEWNIFDSRYDLRIDCDLYQYNHTFPGYKIGRSPTFMASTKIIKLRSDTKISIDEETIKKYLLLL
jgi:hypothetical protein